ncbi:MAG: signal recognition particle-docking protein FtsY [Candidatus Eremiobacteraeota bacterium]|nr:signal recognition particle-docking protein FtsY [Candidatus Eremiobacteraeota bacterium]MBV8204329.1 signal recognition particle-docking protein FtsY [Candidatus Eremiobacteraeota bacterium]MBV8263890.1 signal recognition particle-docking protein FtsY [Candidatus Eremiobacteraeota bacterium]MBV8339563.1 signal recognition particle-docking protein FtsY [Candidatus Eremiobacteraeota bacterium]MBV8460583.1 signal recognition particle-docking protein FtsY [Candidatus Eremiobacteraeota bacterium
MQWLSSLRDGLAKTRNNLAGHFNALLGRKLLDDQFWEELEETLIAADFGLPTTEKIVGDLKIAAQQQNLTLADDVIRVFKTDVADYIKHPAMAPVAASTKPHVVLVVGVNGSGKTTTIGKLAAQDRKQGRSVMLVAADTFRAAAADQLAVWAQRSGAELVRHTEGGDPAAVVFDGLAAAKARGIDVVYVDTAGRLQTKHNLMEELKKIRRIIERAVEGAPHETLLVLDATTGQNALSQAKLFHDATNLTGIVLTKLDGTAKGGIIIAIMDQVDLPVKYIGFGEKVDQLRPFDPRGYVEALF